MNILKSKTLWIIWYEGLHVFCSLLFEVLIIFLLSESLIEAQITIFCSTQIFFTRTFLLNLENHKISTTPCPQFSIIIWLYGGNYLEFWHMIFYSIFTRVFMQLDGFCVLLLFDWLVTWIPWKHGRSFFFRFWGFL